MGQGEEQDRGQSGARARGHGHPVRPGQETPVEEMGPVPAFLKLVYAGLIIWAVLYMIVNWRSGLFG